MKVTKILHFLSERADASQSCCVHYLNQLQVDKCIEIKSEYGREFTNPFLWKFFNIVNIVILPGNFTDFFSFLNLG